MAQQIFADGNPRAPSSRRHPDVAGCKKRPTQPPAKRSKLPAIFIVGFRGEVLKQGTPLLQIGKA